MAEVESIVEGITAHLGKLAEDDRAWGGQRATLFTRSSSAADGAGCAARQ